MHLRPARPLVRLRAAGEGAKGRTAPAPASDDLGQPVIVVSGAGAAPERPDSPPRPMEAPPMPSPRFVSHSGPSLETTFHEVRSAQPAAPTRRSPLAEAAGEVLTPHRALSFLARLHAALDPSLQAQLAPFVGEETALQKRTLQAILHYTRSSSADVAG